MASQKDRDDDDDATGDLIQGIGLLWRAARKTATGIRRDLDRSNVARAIDDAGRELTRAATNVVTRIGAELKRVQPPEPRYADRETEREDEPRREDETQPEDKRPPAGPTPEDPGFRIAVDEAPPDDEKRR